MAHVREALVDDPFEPGSKIATLRSVRDDPLGDHHSRGHIDSAQLMAGREYQRLFQIAERGPRSLPLRDRVDGGLMQPDIDDTQLKAREKLARCHAQLGVDGTALIHDALISALTTRQLAAARGLSGQRYQRYLAVRLYDASTHLR